MYQPTVASLMTKMVPVPPIRDSLSEAHRWMNANRIRHLPVVDEQGRLVGLVTQRMVLAAWAKHGAPKHAMCGATVRELPVEMIMEKDVVTIAPDASVAEAARIMEARRIGCLPVVDKGKLVGILTEADFVRFARRALEGAEVPAGIERGGRLGEDRASRKMHEI